MSFDCGDEDGKNFDRPKRVNDKAASHRVLESIPMVSRQLVLLMNSGACKIFNFFNRAI